MTGTTRLERALDDKRVVAATYDRSPLHRATNRAHRCRGQASARIWPMTGSSWWSGMKRGTFMRDNQDQHDAMRAVDARVVWFCEEPRAIETWGLGYRLVDSHTLAELPAELDTLIPESVRAGMASPRRHRRCVPTS